MTSYTKVESDDSRLAFTGVLIAGRVTNDESEVMDELLPIGTAFFIAPHIALTARHVIDEFAENFHGCKIYEIAGDMNFGIDFGVKHPKYGLMVWSVMAYGYTPTVDMTALILELRDPPVLPRDFSWELPTLSLKQVTQGGEVNAVGFPKSSHKLDEAGNHKIVIDPRESSGHIGAVHELRRDTRMLPHPCFEIDALVPGGMSGGPVFSASGHVVGVAVSGFDLDENAVSPLSYASAIWPCVGIQLQKTIPPIVDAPEPYDLQSLVDKGVIRAVDLQTSANDGHVVTYVRT